MSDIDKQLGESVAILRTNKGLSLNELGEMMASRGFSWSKATVWAVEKGTRPLKLSEAQTLIELLGIDSIEELLEPNNNKSRFLQTWRMAAANLEESAESTANFIESMNELQKASLPLTEEEKEELGIVFSGSLSITPDHIITLARQKVEARKAQAEIEGYTTNQPDED